MHKLDEVTSYAHMASPTYMVNPQKIKLRFLEAFLDVSKVVIITFHRFLIKAKRPTCFPFFANEYFATIPTWNFNKHHSYDHTKR